MADASELDADLVHYAINLMLLIMKMPQGREQVLLRAKFVEMAVDAGLLQVGHAVMGLRAAFWHSYMLRAAFWHGYMVT